MPVTLSHRERQVGLLVLQGLTYRQMAEHLGLGFETIRTYLSRLRRKTGCSNKVELVLWFFNHPDALGDAQRIRSLMFSSRLELVPSFMRESRLCTLPTTPKNGSS